MRAILTNKEGPAQTRRGFQGSPWRLIGWFGFALTTVGLGQLVLYLFPSMGFGSPEWEYGASAQLLGALPLPTIGIAALFTAAAGSGTKRGLFALGLFLLLLAIAVFAVLAMFLTVVPMALRATPDNMRDPVYQTIGRTVLSGAGFGVLYLWAAWISIRQTKR